VCHRSCDGRVAITNISSYGAVGSQQGSAVEGRHHVYCLWILTVFDSFSVDVALTRDNLLSIMLTVPKNNLNTTCLKVSDDFCCCDSLLVLLLGCISSLFVQNLVSDKKIKNRFLQISIVDMVIHLV